MGTNIFDNYGIKITRFYGGIDRGICYQINIGVNDVQLTRTQLRILVRNLQNEFIKKV